MNDIKQLQNSLGYGNGFAVVDATKSTILDVLTRTERFQVNVRRHIDDNYTEFMPNHTTPGVFLDQIGSLKREVDDLLDKGASEGLEALDEANAKMAASRRQLREILLGLEVSDHILKVDEVFHSMEDAKSCNDYMLLQDLLNRLRGLIYGDEPDAAKAPAATTLAPEVRRIFQELECYGTMKVKYLVQAHLLQQNLQERFDRLVQLQCKSFPTSRCVTLQVSRDEAQLQDIVQAVFQKRYSPNRLCDFLLENCIEPLILRPVMVEYTEATEGQGHDQLSLSYSTKEPSATQLRPNYKDVLAHFRLLFQTLGGINISVSSDQHVFGIIGEHVKDRMLKLLVDECLKAAVPETMEEYQSSTLCEDVTNFEQFLADVYLIYPAQDRALALFVEKYPTYYRNRLLRRVLETARDIVQRDLQDMMLVAPNNGPTEVAANPLLFPRCMISKSAQDYVKLMERILRQNVNVESESGNPLCDINASLLQTYIDQVPLVHRKLLESIPQQSALFHNNCMFLTHWVAQQANRDFKSLPALTKSLQATGQRYLRVQIDYQISILKEIMDGFEFQSQHTLGTGPLKMVRQCLRQLDLLKNVWANVLPETVYNATFCELINALAAELIQRVFTLRDISATMATELSDLIDVVLERGPTLFPEPHEVLQVSLWMKLQQLKTIMNASLKEITELWCNGAGPLTANYKSDEVRHLIRALFQDTSRRVQAMAKIS
ncbi:centromere/kinetochore protein zw10 [Drosophila serrata]|uniref:centromere/kinetochore protein zw10 n=1 Tax=Drosophila serrata TaxID=7274 RepID=UPI000A1D01F2|nr:centromere/kinetochore protein zw10 [Drosophila serrata]